MTVSSLFPTDFNSSNSGPIYMFTIEGVNNPLEAGTADALLIKFVNPSSTVIISMYTDFGTGI